jgi:glycolate dehydrogenase FAD-binding subunit
VLTAQTPDCFIEDFGPLPVYRPQSVAEVCNLVHRAVADVQSIYPLGGRTMLDLGLPPTKPGIAIDLTSLDQVIDYPARDMTITVQAGITIAKLQEILAAENQRLPVDVPQPERATLGGAIATNASGPRRYGYGTLRDYVIGITVVNDEGQEVKAGGRVVKNVAGYDLCKLYTGSLGTLGIITQVTLKLRPRPERSTHADIHCQDAAELGPLLDRLHATRTRPVSITVLGPRVAAEVVSTWKGSSSLSKDGWLVLVGFEDTQETVEWQIKQLQSEIRPDWAIYRHWPDAAGAHIWKALADFPVQAAGPLTLKANLLPQATASFCSRVAEFGDDVLLTAHAGNGIVIGHFTGGLTVEQAKPMLTTLLDAAAAAEGNVVLLRCPPAWKRELPVWGWPRGDASLMRAVKEKLDPQRLFNPGRFVDGI